MLVRRARAHQMHRMEFRNDRKTKFQKDKDRSPPTSNPSNADTNDEINTQFQLKKLMDDCAFVTNFKLSPNTFYRSVYYANRQQALNQTNTVSSDLDQSRTHFVTDNFTFCRCATTTFSANFINAHEF